MERMITRTAQSSEEDEDDMWRAGGENMAWEVRKLLTVFRILLERCEGWYP